VRAGKSILAAQSVEDNGGRVATNQTHDQVAGKATKRARTMRTVKNEPMCDSPTASSSKHCRGDYRQIFQAPRGRQHIANQAFPPQSIPGLPSALALRNRTPELIGMGLAFIPAGNNPMVFPQNYQRTTADLERLAQNNPISAEIRTLISTRYCESLSRILGISWRLGANLTLAQLRLYARAYNGHLQDIPWYYTQMPMPYLYALGPWFCEDGPRYTHFATLVQEPYLTIAHARRDIDADGQVSNRGLGYFTPNSAEEMRALGAAPNPLADDHDPGLYSGVDPHLHDI